jgi:hypothetical protein
MFDPTLLRGLLVLSGLGQLALALGSLAIPRVLRWGDDTRKLRPLTRQVFWTYAGYIWTTNVCFGLISVLAPGLLLDRTPLAGLVAGYVAAYWGARIVIQFTYFDRSDAPPGRLVGLAEAALVALFAACVLVYGAVAVRAFGGPS